MHRPFLRQAFRSGLSCPHWRYDMNTDTYEAETRASAAVRKHVNIIYALVQGFYWMSYCCSASFAAVYLQFRGYSNTGLGLILASGFVLGFFIPQFFASLIDRFETVTAARCIGVVFAVQTLLVLGLMQFPGASPAVSLLYIIFLGLVITVNPMNTQLCGELSLRFGRLNYGAARGTGSIVFAPSAVFVGRLLERLSPSILPAADILCILIQALTLLFLSSYARRAEVSLKNADNAPAPEEPGAPSSSAPVSGRQGRGHDFFTFLRENRRFAALLPGIALLFFAHNMIGNYLINVVRNVGGDTSDMGTLSGFTACLEIPMMFLYDRITRKIPCARTIRFAAAVFSIKAFAISQARSMAGLYAANLLQSCSFAIITPGMVRYVFLHIAPEDSAKGQSLAFGMVTLGNVLSSLAGGLLYDSLPVRTVLLAGFFISLAGTLICLIFTEK